jgi:hypothetical protein
MKRAPFSRREKGALGSKFYDAENTDGDLLHMASKNRLIALFDWLGSHSGIAWIFPLKPLIYFPSKHGIVIESGSVYKPLTDVIETFLFYPLLR